MLRGKQVFRSFLDFGHELCPATSEGTEVQSDKSLKTGRENLHQIVQTLLTTCRFHPIAVWKLHAFQPAEDTLLPGLHYNLNIAFLCKGHLPKLMISDVMRAGLHVVL